jgi:hypothetical protein
VHAQRPKTWPRVARRQRRDQTRALRAELVR